MKKIYFDVGANNGDSCIGYATHDSFVFAFEPTPEMINIIKQKTKHLKNYEVVPKAISDIEGKCVFYISGNADWGCSSLCNFQDTNVLYDKWPGRTDFKVTKSIDVDVIRLDTFIENKKREGFELMK